MEDYKATMTPLNPRNFHLWIREVKGVAKKAKVWEYVDPDGDREEPEEPEIPQISGYIVEEAQDVETQASSATVDPPIRRPARRLADLTSDQLKAYKLEMSAYQMVEKINDRVAQGIRLVDAAVKASARSYIPSEKMEATVRDILKLLALRYKRSNSEIIQQIYQQYQLLKTPPVKAKIESWVVDWEAMRSLISEMNVEAQFGGEIMFVKEFLKAGRPWAPMFCDHWIDQREAAELPIEFYDTARRYRVKVDETLIDSRSTKGHGQAHAATLQGNEQNAQNNQKKGKANPKAAGSNDSRSAEEKYQGKQCICGEVHIFKNCPYINTSARQQGWKEEKQVRDEMRQRISNHKPLYTVIRRITNTNILEGISEATYAPKENNATNQQQAGNGGNGENSAFHFANTAYGLVNTTGRAVSRNPLHNSVIFDSGAAGHVAWNKNRFVGEITPPNEEVWIGTPMGDMQVMGYGLMKVKAMLNGKPRDLLFENTAYVPDSDVTLISSTRLRNNGFVWNMRTDSLEVEKSYQKICDVGEHFGLPTLEYNSMPPSLLANAIQPRHQEKATPWIWHLRLGHCRPEVIQHLKTIAEVEVMKGETPKTVQCETCAVSKMKEIINRGPTARATRPFQVLHFDITINDIAFDSSRCIAHFTDEFTSFSWVYPLPNHKEATLLPVFKSLINQCDRAGLASKAVVSVIRTGQETSIDRSLENWILIQGIKWDWSAKNTPSQNGTSERFGAMLTEKARCIRHHGKLPEDLYPECYLAAAYMLNRTPTKSLKWESPLTYMQRFTGQVIRWEISHLRVFGCKAFPLLKGVDKPPRSQKMKPRAFVGYLIGYDSTNIIRVWNPEKGDVSGYGIET